MKRIFLSALIGIGVIAAILQVLSGSEAARMQQSYALVCRGGANLPIGPAPGERNFGFVFTRGTRSASQGLAPGECSWADRGMRSDEPDRLSQHVENGIESLRGNLAPENRWYEELHSPDKYWTFMVYNDRQQLIVTGARPNEEMSASPRPKPRVPVEIRKLDWPKKKKTPVEPPVSKGTRIEDVPVSTPSRGSGGKVEVAPATIQDISPESEFGDPPSGVEASGPVYTIVANPKDPNVLYAASLWAGIWKSTDGAQKWRPANRGLATPFSQTVIRALAIDDDNPQRLLFAAYSDDFRPPKALGGLWFSADAAGHWIHVDLPGCLVPDVYAVGFTGGVAFAQTGCGIFVAKGDPTLTTSWRSIPDPPGVEGFVLMGSNSRLYTCGTDTKVKPTDKPTTTVAYRGIESTGPWTFATSLPLGPCDDLAVAPDDPNDLIVAFGDTNLLLGRPIKVWRARVGSSFNGALGEGFTFPTGGSGGISLHAVRRPHALSKGPGLSYDLFIADGSYFHQYEAGTWHELTPRIHIDTHTMAFPSTYDPEKGNCIAWAASDGGVYATTTKTDGTPCETYSGWFHASHGLHVMVSAWMAGVRSCGLGRNACPAIYLPTDHDDLWGSLNGGSEWTRIGGLGDAGSAMVDPALPGQVLGARGGGGADKNPFYKYKPKDGTWLATDIVGNLNDPSGKRLYGGWANLTLTQIMTLPSDDEVERNGDYVSLERPVDGPLTAYDKIVRNKTGAEPDWTDEAVFQRDAVAALAVSGGHKNPVYYVLTNAGDVFVSCSSPTPPALCSSDVAKKSSFGTSSKGLWASASANLGAGNLFVNPYDPQNLYATTGKDSIKSSTEKDSIKSSTDGGRTWADEPDLNEVATNGGEFRLGCMAGFCSLAQMIFDRNHPNYRFALLSPGGVAFSRDSGKHWIAIQGPWSYGRSFSSDESRVLLPERERVFPFVLPFSGFYDDTEVDPIRHTSSLYVALRGRGIVRVDAPFAKLGVEP